MRRTITARTHQEIARLRYLWDGLETQRPATMFQSFMWNYVAAATFADREAPHVIYAESDGGTALIPAAVDQINARLTFLGETLFDYRDVLWEGDEQLLHAAWTRAAHFGLPFSGGAVRADAKLAAWSSFNVSDFYGAPRVSPGGMSADDFASRHCRLARGYRRLQREGVSMRCRTGRHSELVHFVYQQKGSQPAQTGDNLFRDRLRIQFMVDICQQVGSACEIFTLESAGTLVAALVTFRDRQVRRFYTVYFDHQWGRYSPGVVLIYEVTELSLRDGLECDYMTGEHGYKQRFAASIVPMYWVDASAEMLASLGKQHRAQAA